LSVTISVASIWKGVAEKEVVVTTGTDDGNCGYKFAVGKTYLVYANASGKGAKKALSTSSCHRTDLLEKAGEDLKDIGKGRMP
jgi:hypothetical protein